MDMETNKNFINRKEVKKEEQNPDYDISKFQDFNDRIMAAELETEEEDILREKLDYLKIESKKSETKDRTLFLFEQLGSGVGYGEFTDKIVSIRDILENKLVEFAEDTYELEELYKKVRAGSSAREATLLRLVEEYSDFDQIWSLAAKISISSTATEERYSKIRDLAIKKIALLPEVTLSQLKTAELLTIPGSETDKIIKQKIEDLS